MNPRDQVSTNHGGTGSHIQIFVYRIPRKNHAAMLQLLGQLASTFRKHGTLQSEFYQLGGTEAFQGFTNFAATTSAGPDEEVWVELDRYRDRAQRDRIVASVGGDKDAEPLFGQLMGLVSEGYSVIMGDFGRLEM